MKAQITLHIDLDYTDRTALLADGWDFLARTASGATRNTEQSTGLVVSYDQSLHPGVLRIPTDQGSPWAGNNDTRNTLFRDLPEDWQSLRLKVAAFAPTTVFQSVCLLAYQDDDDYVTLCRDYIGSQTVEWWRESGGSPAVLGSLAVTATSALLLRLDRDLATDTLSAFVSLDDGASWTTLPGSVVQSFPTPRLGIFVGGNTSTTDFPPADLAFVEILQEDTDNDGLSDAWELRYFGDLDQTASGDFDGDGLTNLQEQTADTNPTLADTDGDGFPDGQEVSAGSDPRNPNSTPVPLLQLSPTSLSFTGIVAGPSPPGQPLTLTDTSDGTLNWAISTDQPWLTVSSTSGTTPGSITVTVSTADLAAGKHNGTITVTSPQANNSPQTVSVTFEVLQGIHRNFTYVDRTALLADGWDFLARTASGATRNTEQSTGLVVSYDQSLHPGVLRIPTDQGSPWAGNNDTRNTLFRDLPEDWQSLRLKVAAFAPTTVFQSVCLLAYQDDDDYVTLCRDYIGSQTVEWWRESGGSPAVLGSLAVTATSALLLRLDRDLATDTLSAFVSLDDGASWTTLPGSVVQSFPTPRLGIFVGGNTSTTDFPPADLAFAQIITPMMDSDGDGLSDKWELRYFGDLDQTASGDFDGDGLTNLQEQTADTNPTLADTDGDGFPDGQEVSAGSDPRNPNSTPVPLLQLSPTSLSFSVVGGSSPPGQSLTIINTGPGTLNWTVTDDQPWLTVSSTSGTTPGTITVSVSTIGLAAGTYNGTITVSASQTTNSPQTVPVTLEVIQGAQLNFTYVDRTALLADGWDFLARTASGATRNTEQSTGLVVSYDQSLHPGVLRIPTDQGSPWAGNNDTRNTLFRDLPEDWQSLRLKVAAFAPTASYQSVCLMAYQDDDNYVALCRDYTGSQQVEWWQETGGNPAVLGSRATSATTDVLLRLDHDMATGTLTASFSLDGSETWLALPGSVVKILNTPRLGIFVGGNTSTSSFPPVDLQFVAVIGPPPAVEASPASLSFSSLENGADPASQSLSITNTSLGTLSWTASLNQPWLSVSPTSGTTPGTITVSVTTSGLAAGTYNGTITVTSPEASNSPQLIPVSLRIISLSDTRVLTVAVLVNAANSAGYNPNPLSPGEFQRYPERYLEHLQVPYEIFDVSTESPPSDLFDRQLIIAGHRGLNLNSTWREAVVDAVNIGVGFINLDWDPQIGSQSHIQMIFGTSGSSAGLPGSTISVPSNVAPGGSTPHFIAGLQKRFLGDPGGAIVYNFHRDENNIIQTVRSTVLTGSGGTVIARLGSDPLILATSFGAGRAVHFGTLEYLKADRFGFLQGVDDLFWRSLVWAARKPFVLRGYPRLWAVQMDDTEPGWAFRVRDMYDPIITGNVGANGIGGPWKVTGYVYTDNLPSESAERASVIADINAGLLQVSPHSFDGVSFGDLYWNGEAERELTDAEWLENLNNVLAWQHGSGGADTIPSFARSMVPHFWDLSDNTGFDLWNSLGFRYVTSIQKPGFHSYYDVTINGGAERPNARPFWLYEKPPKVSRDEDQPFFFADDYTVHSRDGQAAKTFFLFATQVHGLSAPRPDVIWPTSGSSQVSYEWTVAQSLDQFQRHTWRFWSSFAPTQIFTHDSFNYTLSSPTDRRSVIRDLSTWLENLNVRHVFMEDLGDYLYARSKSVLTRATFADGKITYVFTGDAATADGVLVATDAYVFLTDDDGTPVTIPGFTGGNTITLPIPAP